MENYDRRRGQSSDDERYRARPGYEDRAGGEGESRSQWSQEDQRPRRAERGWLDYDRDYGQRDEDVRGREERYGRGGGERPRFSPDWSREGEQPRQSDEQYYSRNRERGGSDERSRRGWQGDDWEQRARSSLPREQYERAERSEPGDYYDPDWPYQRGARGRGRETERSRDDEQQSHYRGYYRSEGAPFSYPGGSGYLYSETWTLHGPYTGRGPKGYKRSDQQIVEEACQRLERNGDIDASDIEVSAEDGVIRLRGTVGDRKTKRRAEECVESVYGARDVMNELRVSQQSGEAEERQRSLEDSQASQSGRGAQASQSSSLGAQGSQSQGSQSTTPGMRSGTGSSSEQSEDKRAKH